MPLLSGFTVIQWSKCDKSVDLLFHILLVQRKSYRWWFPLPWSRCQSGAGHGAFGWFWLGWREGCLVYLEKVGNVKSLVYVCVKMLICCRCMHPLDDSDMYLIRYGGRSKYAQHLSTPIQPIIYTYENVVESYTFKQHISNISMTGTLLVLKQELPWNSDPIWTIPSEVFDATIRKSYFCIQLSKLKGSSIILSSLVKSK